MLIKIQNSFLFHIIRSGENAGMRKIRQNAGFPRTIAGWLTPMSLAHVGRGSSVVRGSQIAQLTIEWSRVRIPVAPLRNLGAFVYPTLSLCFG